MEYLEIDSSSCKPCSSVDLELSSSSSSSASADHQPSMAVSNTHKRKAGRIKFKETRHPVFRGVRQRKGNKWVSEIREPYKKSRIWLGTFPNPEMAARAYDVAVLALRGKSAALNFPDSASVLPRAKSSSPKDIQVAALAAAEANFKPENSTNIDHGLSLEITNANDNELNYGFMDEEALFNMPGLLNSMAEGLLLASPALQTQVYDWDDDDDDKAASTINIDLWGHYL